MPPSSFAATPDLFPGPKHMRNLQHRRTRECHLPSLVVCQNAQERWKPILDFGSSYLWWCVGFQGRSAKRWRCLADSRATGLCTPGSRRTRCGGKSHGKDLIPAVQLVPWCYRRERCYSSLNSFTKWKRGRERESFLIMKWHVASLLHGCDLYVKDRTAKGVWEICAVGQD